MAREILTPFQEKFIRLFARAKTLKKNFYLTGGTALSAYYLKHRLSEDLDFFSHEAVAVMAIEVFLKESKPALGLSKIDFQQSFNRNIFFLHSKSGILKTEFTYFPFEQVAKPALKDGLCVDSLIDIAVNKVFTIVQNPRSRDFIDLYFILNKHKKFSFDGLLRLARIKFDAQIDPVHLGTQLLKAKNIQDLPRMLARIDHSQWRDYFLAQARVLSKGIFK